MPEPNRPGENSIEATTRRYFYLIVTGSVVVLLVAMLMPKEKVNGGRERTLWEAGISRPRAIQADSAQASKAAESAEQIVASKVDQFARDRLRITRVMAKRKNIELPPEVERFFDAVAEGRWDDLNDAYKSLVTFRDSPGGEKLRSLWGPILETLLIAECAHLWPAQKLLEYGQATIGSLAPGMVYVGGTDPGRGIPTLLNETSGGDRHIVLTQNGLADGTYLDYLRFLYADQMTLPSEEQTKQAFDDYIADAQKRFDHDRQFPDQPKQVRPGEDIQMVESSENGRAGGPGRKIQVSGQVAVMAINERILQSIMDKNPGMSFALEESFPLRSTYSSAVPLGPIMELRAPPEGQNAFTQESASKALDYWRSTAETLASDAEAPQGSDVRKTYSHMASSQANLLAEHNYNAEAEQTYRLAMTMEPSNPEAVYALAGLLAKTGRTEEARELVESFARNHPGMPESPEASLFVRVGGK
jgi:hypothetical protein